MPDPQPTRRRLFQFGIGTMLVLMTVFAVWLGWELNFIRQRKAFLEAVQREVELQDQAARAAGEDSNFLVLDIPGPTGKIPVWRQWLGDEAAEYVRLPKKAAASDLKKAGKLFPEAHVVQ